jgi:ribosomal protein S27E
MITVHSGKRLNEIAIDPHYGPDVIVKDPIKLAYWFGLTWERKVNRAIARMIKAKAHEARLYARRQLVIDKTSPLPQTTCEAKALFPEKTEPAERVSLGGLMTPIVAGYKGFLYLRCTACRSTKAFCAKQPTTVLHCEQCHEQTPLKDLTDLDFDCTHCGNHFFYKTNIHSPSIEIQCFTCGTKNTVKFNTATLKYEGRTKA